MKVWLKRIGLGLVAVFLLIQIVPYGRDHDQPPVSAEPDWDSARTRELAVNTCFDCHSNETEWPWYSNVAPVSWLVQYDVDEGREKLNFSEWDTPQEEAEESAETVREGEMPPKKYVFLHPAADLSDTEEQDLIDGLVATFGDEEGGDEGGED